MKFYYLSKSLEEKTLRFNCYDNNQILRSLVFTTLDILKKYPITDTLFLSQISFLDFLLQKEDLNCDFIAFHENVGRYFEENKEFLKKNLTETDYLYLSEIIKRSPSLDGNPFHLFESITQDRENVMFEHINKSYNDSTFFFCIIGSWHIRKPYCTSEIIPNLKNNNISKPVLLVEMLEKNKISQFKNKIIICNLVSLITKSKSSFTDKVINMPGYYPPALQKHSDYLNSLLTGNITLLDMRKTNIKHANKITDFLIVVKEAKRIQ
jgi:hypothetical protein